MTETEYLQDQSERTRQRLRSAIGDPRALGQPGLLELVRRRPVACLVVAVVGGALVAGALRRIGPAGLRQGLALAGRLATPALRTALSATLGLGPR